MLLELLVFSWLQPSLHHAAHRVGAAAISLGQLGAAFASAVASHDFDLLAVSEPSGSHGTGVAQQTSVGRKSPLIQGVGGLTFGQLAPLNFEAMRAEPF